MRGGEKVLEALCAIFPGAPIFTLFHFPGTVSESIESHRIHTSFLQRAPGLRRNYRRWLPLFPAAIEDFDLSSFDLVVSSSHCAAKGARPSPHARHVCYCHTPMRYAWDQEHAYFARRHGLRARLRGLLLSALRVWDSAASARVDRFIANSRFVAARIWRYYRRTADVVAPPVNTEFHTPADEQRGGYALAVAALAPYKRLDLAIEACLRSGVELRIVGDGPDRGRLERLAERLARAAPASAIRFLGRVDQTQLRSLYRGARCLLQPGVEDFGIAAVEALACGTPVVATAMGGVLDVVEDSVHGLLTRPEDGVEALASAVDKCGTFGFNPLNLRSRAEAFSSAAFRERLMTLLDDALASGGGAP
jgi:glycosyltransferase involved in cell wall biosynthesis